jgi:hypothetical protein
MITMSLDVINSATFSPYGGGPVTIDHENTVKAYSASPSMLGRGHLLLEPSGPVWVRINSAQLQESRLQRADIRNRVCMRQTIILSWPSGPPMGLVSQQMPLDLREEADLWWVVLHVSFFIFC